MHTDLLLIFSGQASSESSLYDEAALEQVLLTLPSLLGMKALRSPVVTAAISNPGLEGYVPIDTSNITISTYSSSRMVIGCLHSCREFDGDRAIEFLAESFGITRLNYTLVTSDGLDSSYYADPS